MEICAPQPASTPLVSVRQLGFHYPDGPIVLHDLDLHWSKGDVIELRGGNGSGKTTLLKLLAGALRPTRGSILVAGTNVVDASIRGQLAMARYVPQRVFEYFLFATIAEEVRVSQPPRTASPATADLLASYGIAADPTTNPGDLADLAAWRLVLLLSNLAAPVLLLVDELPSFSSARCRVAMERVIAARRGAGLVTVFSTHRETPISTQANQLVAL